MSSLLPGVRPAPGLAQSQARAAPGFSVCFPGERTWRSFFSGVDRLPGVCALQRRLRVWPRCALMCGALGWEAGVWLRGSRRPPVPLSPGREVGVAAGARAPVTFTARPRLAPTLVSWCNYAVLSCFWDVCDFTQPARAPPTRLDGGAAGTPCRLLPRALKTALPRHALLLACGPRPGCTP